MKIRRFNSLEVHQHPDRVSLGLAAARGVAAALTARGTKRVVFACAPSQDEFFEALIVQPVDWGMVTVFHMDEYVGLPADHPACFRHYLGRHLFSQITHGNVHYIRADPDADPDAEAARYASELVRKPIDLVCLGIGENGHLAFNDPAVADFADPAFVKLVALDDACRRQQVHDGCFTALDDVPTHALTLTIPALLSAREISCVVAGERKAKAVRDALLGPIATSCPASILRTHPRAVLHLDDAAAALLPA